MVAYAQEHGYAFIVDGTNADDQNDHRPGREAAREREVRSPLLEAELALREMGFVEFRVRHHDQIARIEVEAADFPRLIDQALAQLKNLPYEDLGFAQIDLHRPLRTGDPEVVFCPSKTNAQVAQIFKLLSQQYQRVMGTRATLEQAQAVQELLPEAVYNSLSRLIVLNRDEIIDFPPDYPYILVTCAGTADLPVAEEAAQTAEFFGSRVQRAFDIGVAGIHRLFSKLDLVQNANVIISVAGMEGARNGVIPCGRDVEFCGEKWDRHDIDKLHTLPSPLHLRPRCKSAHQRCAGME